MDSIIVLHQAWYGKVHSLKCDLCVCTWKLKLKTAYCQQTLMLGIDIELCSNFHWVNPNQGWWMHLYPAFAYICIEHINKLIHFIVQMLFDIFSIEYRDRHFLF